MRHSFFVVMIGLIVSPAVQAQIETQTTHVCALQEPDGPRPRGLGTIIGIQDVSLARADISLREARRGGAIDPSYLNDMRAVVRGDNGIVDIFNVPSGMSVHVGDRVKLLGSYRSAASTCSYIPQMAIPNDAPAA